MAHEETLRRSEQLAKTHQQDTLEQTQLESALHSSLESLLQGDLVRLFQDVRDFDVSIVSAFLIYLKVQWKLTITGVAYWENECYSTTRNRSFRGW